MGYSLIDGKTYRQINLKPTGFSKDPGGQHAPLHASTKGSVCSVTETRRGSTCSATQSVEKYRGSASAVMTCSYDAYGHLAYQSSQPSLGVSLLRIIQRLPITVKYKCSAGFRSESLSAHRKVPKEQIC